MVISVKENPPDFWPEGFEGLKEKYLRGCSARRAYFSDVYSIRTVAPMQQLFCMPTVFLARHYFGVQSSP